MNLATQTGFIWIDGEYVDCKDAKVHVLSHGLHYGSGVFEGVRAYKTKQGTAIFKLQEHTKRLLNSAHILNMPVKYTLEELNKVQLEILHKNNLSAAYIRPVIFYDVGHLSVNPKELTTKVVIAAWKWGKYFNKADENIGIRVQTSSFNRNYINSVMCKAKANGNYINSILALQEANRAGYDEALMLDNNGFISEGSSANVFIVKNSVLFTPNTATILEGITRASVIQIANDLQIQVVEKNLSRDDAYTADEMFFTGTAAEITPVSELDGRKIGNGKRGPISKKLQNIFSKIVADQDKKYKDWLTY